MRLERGGLSSWLSSCCTFKVSTTSSAVASLTCDDEDPSSTKSLSHAQIGWIVPGFLHWYPKPIFPPGRSSGVLAFL